MILRNLKLTTSLIIYIISVTSQNSNNSTYSKICRGDLLCGFINQINGNNKTFQQGLQNCEQKSTLEWAQCFSTVADLSDAQDEIFIKQANWTDICKTNFTKGLSSCEKNCKSTTNNCSNNCISRVNSDNHGCIALYARVSNDTLFKANQCAGLCPINRGDLLKAYDCIIDCESIIMKGMHIDVFRITSIADSFAYSELSSGIKLGLNFILVSMIQVFIIL